jgi:hypothetical protein
MRAVGRLASAAAIAIAEKSEPLSPQTLLCELERQFPKAYLSYATTLGNRLRQSMTETQEHLSTRYAPCKWLEHLPSSLDFHPTTAVDVLHRITMMNASLVVRTHEWDPGSVVETIGPVALDALRLAVHALRSENASLALKGIRGLLQSQPSGRISGEHFELMVGARLAIGGLTRTVRHLPTIYASGSLSVTSVQAVAGMLNGDMLWAGVGLNVLSPFVDGTVFFASHNKTSVVQAEVPHLVSNCSVGQTIVIQTANSGKSCDFVLYRRRGSNQHSVVFVETTISTLYTHAKALPAACAKRAVPVNTGSSARLRGAAAPQNMSSATMGTDASLGPIAVVSGAGTADVVASSQAASRGVKRGRESRADPSTYFHQFTPKALAKLPHILRDVFALACTPSFVATEQADKSWHLERSKSGSSPANCWLQMLGAPVRLEMTFQGGGSKPHWKLVTRPVASMSPRAEHAIAGKADNWDVSIAYVTNSSIEDQGMAY